MLKKLLKGSVAIVLLSVSVFFVVIVGYLVSSEVSPAIQNGSLNVETSTMILNRVWDGNEIYILLGLYLLLACAFAYSGINAIRDLFNYPAIRPAVPDEAPQLATLATRSKAYWEYSDEFMEACREELAVTPKDIAEVGVYFVVAEVHKTIVGFYALKRLSPLEFDLLALYVDPDHIGHGCGSVLLTHAVSAVRTMGGERLQIQSDPNAAGFYESAGARQIGTSESGSIRDRFLPLLEIEVLR